MLAPTALAALAAEVAASSGPNWWTLLGGAVGGVISVAATHYFTRSRERGAWLRQLQVDANRDLYASAQELMTFVTTANPDRSKHPMGWDAGRLSELIAGLNHAVLKTMQVGEADTLAASSALVQAFPRLAYQALPIPGTMHNAGMEQREAAIHGMSAMLAEVAAVMRQDIGLLSRKERRELGARRATPMYRSMLLSPVDRPGAHLEKLLWEWEVLTVAGDEVPDSITAYEVATVDVKTPSGFVPQGVLFKDPASHWRFGVKRDLSPAAKNNIIADALRLITGHTQAFQPLHKPKSINPMTHQLAFVWFDVLP
ncbi:Uncharacterised protein [Mycobacteroides abscessus subsp. massiliense]|uniref:hypothetical protein n=1 Tax=Mycobacteroides abscessus TaxID=36809 RepID=UPI0009A73964|nr:hypothetical protein [Mycobacteroides abscessus]SKT53671.1 Uncharacterised protein [Mycobacteroides abscessus subsp. massiliense]